MGLKFELILVSLIVATSIYMMSIKLHDHNKRYADDGKELEFYDTTFTEVNRTGPVSVSYGLKGERIDNVLYIETFRYRNNEIERLTSQKARDTGDRIYLDGKVKAKRYDGFKYKTEHAVYDKVHDIMEATSPFVAFRDPNTLLGETMRYDVKNKTLYATKVRAIIVINEKNTTTDQPKKRKKST